MNWFLSTRKEPDLSQMLPFVPDEVQYDTQGRVVELALIRRQLAAEFWKGLPFLKELRKLRIVACGFPIHDQHVLNTIVQLKNLNIWLSKI